MKIIYQWVPGAYMNIAAEEVAKNLWLQDSADICGVQSFEEAWEEVEAWSVAVLAIENSYAGPIHINLFSFQRYDACIIGTYNLQIDHCLLSHHDDISQIKTLISHPQALSQCHNYMKDRDITAEKFYDTAGAAKHVAENLPEWYGAIASTKAAELYGLNIVEQSIQDQSGNTTRFIVVCLRSEKDKYCYTQKKWKTTLLFKAKHIPASLYKCLGAFATNNVNLTKIENLPSFHDPFSATFWADIQWHTSDENVQKALEELGYFTSEIRILGEY